MSRFCRECNGYTHHPNCPEGPVIWEPTENAIMENQDNDPIRPDDPDYYRDDSDQPETAIAVRPQQPLGTATAAPLTAAQGKVDAIANLTAKVYDRASLLQFTEEESKRLQAEFPDEAFRKGAAGKDSLIYIEHAHLRQRLNEVLGLGQWSLITRSRWTEPTNNGTRVYVEAMLCIRGCFVDEAIGDMEYLTKNASMNYGDAVEGAKTQALRRCCKTLGVGLQAWSKSWCEGWWKRNPTGHPQHKPQQQAQNGQQATPAEIGRTIEEWMIVAKGGLLALQNEWNKLSIDRKKALQSHMPALKKIANEADDAEGARRREESHA